MINAKAVIATVVLLGGGLGCKDEPTKPQYTLKEKSVAAKEEKPGPDQRGEVDGTPTDTQPKEVEAPYVDPVAVSPANYEVLAEGDFTRVLRATFEPGSKTAVHSHPLAFIYALTDVEGRSQFKDRPEEPLTLREGEARVLPASRSYVYEHVGKEKESFLIFEVEPMKADTALPEDAAPSLPKVAPKSVKVLVENQEARLMVSEIKKGEEQKNFSYGPHATYILAGGTLKALIPEIPPQKVELKVGATHVEPAIPNLTVRNIGKSNARVLILELKQKP